MTIPVDKAMATNRYNNFVKVTTLRVQNVGDAVILESVYVGGTRCNAIALTPADWRAAIAAIEAELAR